MKRDNELVRSIMLDMEANPMPSPGRHVFIDEIEALIINEHLVLLQDHRLMECLIIRGNRNELTDAFAKQVTPEGHQFLKGAKNKSIWNQTIAKSGNAGFGSFIKSLRNLTEAAFEEEEAALPVA